jgi:gamma-glutamyltranspeptidase/glutathione hydrolase
LGRRFCDVDREGGWTDAPGDLAKFRAEVDEPTRVNYRGYEVYKVGFWSQGPVMLETLNLLEGYDLKAMGHNSSDYVHTSAEAIKLAFADRDHYYGDPRVVKIPGAELLSKDYAVVRRRLIDPRRASLEQRPGDPRNKRPLIGLTGAAETGPSSVPLDERANDTTCVNVIDAAGQMSFGDAEWRLAAGLHCRRHWYSGLEPRCRAFCSRPGHAERAETG